MEVFRFLFAIFISYFPAVLARSMSLSSKGWYFSLIKPQFSPPSWVFGVVWSILYFIIGLSFYFFCLAKGTFEQKKLGYIFFVIQLMLNASFIPLVLLTKSLLWGVIVCVLLAVFVILTMIEFAKTSALAAYLLIPYLMWSFFAIFLSYKIYLLNV
jgi:tryptophan-rich sensory protein